MNQLLSTLDKQRISHRHGQSGGLLLSQSHFERALAKNSETLKIDNLSSRCMLWPTANIRKKENKDDARNINEGQNTM